jgi:heterodisulfide reductase subunit A
LVLLLKPLSHILLEAGKHALLIGGGVSGLRAARQISKRGLKVTLVEKSPFLGGRMAQLEETFPHGTPARDELHPLIAEVLSDPNIEGHTGTEVTGVKGYIGDFSVTARRVSRGVSDDAGDLKEAMRVCPVTVPDEFNYGLTDRKALYLSYEGCYPPVPAVDWANCTKCGECRKAPGGRSIRLDGEAESFELGVGAIVVATGFKPYEPREGEYGFGQIPGVMTLPAFIRFLALSRGGKALEFEGRPVRRIGFVHCVGSRHIDGVHDPMADGKVNDYCSRVCCTASLHVAKEILERYPETKIFDYHEDIRAYGRGHEDIYTEVSSKGVFFLRFHGDHLPAAEPGTDGDGRILVRTVDHLTDGMEVETAVDLLVLAVGFLPAPGVIDWDVGEEERRDLAKLLKINPGADRFLQEVHPKLRPVETAVSGIVLAGAAQGPMNIQESCAAASAAAAKVAVLLSRGQVELEPFVAVVDSAKCDGTGACVEVCQYEDAIALRDVDGESRAVITPANCSGCGVCVSACPNGAIDVQGFTIGQYEAMIDALLGDLPDMEVGA